VFTRALIALSFAFVASTSAVAAGACDAAEYRQFDFWLGEWQVHIPKGKLAGVNRISTEYGGCVVHEHYSGSGGFSGESLNTFDTGRKVWHQTWVDNSGTLLLLEGGLQGRSMVLQGQTVGADGQATKHRITWTPNADGSVRQLWESSEGNGPWSVAFDGIYTTK
jgi:hypothetical protein